MRASPLITPPKHGSRLNPAEMETGLWSRECPGCDRVATFADLPHRTGAPLPDWTGPRPTAIRSAPAALKEVVICLALLLIMGSLPFALAGDVDIARNFVPISLSPIPTAGRIILVGESVFVELAHVIPDRTERDTDFPCDLARRFIFERRPYLICASCAGRRRF